jgi:hypothetical protein
MKPLTTHEKDKRVDDDEDRPDDVQVEVEIDHNGEQPGFALKKGTSSRLHEHSIRRKRSASPCK